MSLPRHSTPEEILGDARERARKLLDAVNGDADSLRASRDASHHEGAALCDEVAHATRELIAELERRTENPSP